MNQGLGPVCHAAATSGPGFLGEAHALRPPFEVGFGAGRAQGTPEQTDADVDEVRTVAVVPEDGGAAAGTEFPDGIRRGTVRR